MSNEEIVPGFDKEKDDSIKIRLQKIDDKCIVLYLNGYLDIYNSVITKKRFDMVIEAGYKRLIFECQQLNYMSSSPIGIFVHLMKTLRMSSGDLVLIHVQPKVYEVLNLLGFSQFFTVLEDLDDAIRSFDGKEVKEWPIIFECPICSKKLKAGRAGRYRCHECRTILVINPEMQVALG